MINLIFFSLSSFFLLSENRVTISNQSLFIRRRNKEWKWSQKIFKLRNKSPGFAAWFNHSPFKNILKFHFYFSLFPCFFLFPRLFNKLKSIWIFFYSVLVFLFFFFFSGLVCVGKPWRNCGHLKKKNLSECMQRHRGIILFCFAFGKKNNKKGEMT